MSEWVKCADRMPPLDARGVGTGSDYVLVCIVYKDGSGHDRLYGHFDRQAMFWDDGGSRKPDDDEVWYWQPFPAPPVISPASVPSAASPVDAAAGASASARRST